jgi:hypothetical protein
MLDLSKVATPALRILAEYLPLSRFQRQHIQDTIVFMGSARLKSREAALAAVAEAEKTGIALESARTVLELSEYYEAARTLAHRLTEWSKNLADEDRRLSSTPGRSWYHGSCQSRRFRGQGIQCRPHYFDTQRGI